MKKLWFIDEGLDRMGGVERILNTLSNDLVNEFDVELISVYKSRKEPYFKYDNRIKIHYLYDKSNLFSRKYKSNKLIYYSIRLIEKIIEKITITIKSYKYSKLVSKNDYVVYGRVDTALIFLPHIKETKKTIVREAIHLEYHKKKDKIKKYFPSKVDIFILSSDENINSYKEFLGNSVRLEKVYNPLTIEPRIIKNLDSKIVMSVGRYDTHKGYDYLIRAYKEVSKKHPDWKLHIVGDGYYKEKMEKLIIDLNLSDSVKLIPATKDVVSELNKASIYVMASRYEGYANALVEAMCCGLSCISYDWLMGVSDIITNNKNGIIVNLTDRYRYFKTLDVIDEDVNNLSNAIINLIENKKLREKFVKEAPKIKEKRNKNDIINKWKEFICEE